MPATPGQIKSHRDGHSQKSKKSKGPPMGEDWAITIVPVALPV